MQSLNCGKQSWGWIPGCVLEPVQNCPVNARPAAYCVQKSTSNTMPMMWLLRRVTSAKGSTYPTDSNNGRIDRNATASPQWILQSARMQQAARGQFLDIVPPSVRPGVRRSQHYEYIGLLYSCSKSSLPDRLSNTTPDPVAAGISWRLAESWRGRGGTVRLKRDYYMYVTEASLHIPYID